MTASFAYGLLTQIKTAVIKTAANMLRFIIFSIRIFKKKDPQWKAIVSQKSYIYSSDNVLDESKVVRLKLPDASFAVAVNLTAVTGSLIPC